MTNTTATIVGNCTRDPELRFLNTGVALATFGVAVNNRKRNPQTNEWEDGEPEFYDVTCWRELAENVVESITKGTRVVVVGRLQQRSWETEDGSKRSKVEVVADEASPSLRWATAQVVRTERRPGGDAPPLRAVPSPSTPPASAGYDYDEEPF